MLYWTPLGALWCKKIEFVSMHALWCKRTSWQLQMFLYATPTILRGEVLMVEAFESFVTRFIMFLCHSNNFLVKAKCWRLRHTLLRATNDNMSLWHFHSESVGVWGMWVICNLIIDVFSWYIVVNKMILLFLQWYWAWLIAL